MKRVRDEKVKITKRVTIPPHHKVVGLLQKTAPLSGNLIKNLDIPTNPFPSSQPHCRSRAEFSYNIGANKLNPLEKAAFLRFRHIFRINNSAEF